MYLALIKTRFSGDKYGKIKPIHGHCKKWWLLLNSVFSVNVNKKLHIFFKSWSRILCSVSPIKSCIEYLAAFNALFIKPYYIHDTGSRLQASLPSWCSKRLVRHSKIHIYHYYTSFFFYFTHHILILVSYFLFFNSFSCIYFCSFFPCWSKVNWIGKHSLNCRDHS